MNPSSQPSPQILFVDDEAATVKYFQMAASALAPVITAGTAEEGKRLLDKHAGTLSVLVSDQRMPGGYGNELLHHAQANHPHIVRILTTAYSELDNTIEAVNQGRIHRYIRKPWDLSALKMELRQALEFAALRREHAQLLREKMMVLQRQTVSNRIGALYALCASLAGPGNPSPVDNYLAVADAIGVTPPQPDWRSMDYADLVSAEAFRCARFGHAVRDRLAAIAQRRPDDEGALALLQEMLPGRAQVVGDGTVLLAENRNFAEFLETPSGAEVSALHAAWLAYLIWLHGAGKSLQFTRMKSGLQCRLSPAAPSLAPERLAGWISQFCDAP
jgi:two-component system probable response regulator PhcQ